MIGFGHQLRFPIRRNSNTLVLIAASNFSIKLFPPLLSHSRRRLRRHLCLWRQYCTSSFLLSRGGVSRNDSDRTKPWLRVRRLERSVSIISRLVVGVVLYFTGDGVVCILIAIVYRSHQYKKIVSKSLGDLLEFVVDGRA